MANIIQRITTWAAGQVLKAADLNGEFNNVVNVINNINSGSQSLTSPVVSADPTTALGIATKQYVDHYSTYRKPVLVYNSSTVVNVETGINGTSGQLRILFPDGTLRTDSTSGHIQCNLAQTASLTGAIQGGIWTSDSLTNNSWFSIYAVESQADTTNILVVGRSLPPIQSNYATLNSNFGTNAWVYLGLARYGDGDGTANAILKFTQSGHITSFRNVTTTSGTEGLLLFASGGASSGSYTYASGMGTTNIPNNISHTFLYGNGVCGAGANRVTVATQSSGYSIGTTYPASATYTGANLRCLVPAVEGLSLGLSTSGAMQINLVGFIDGALGVGANPLL